VRSEAKAHAVSFETPRSDNVGTHQIR